MQVRFFSCQYSLSHKFVAFLDSPENIVVRSWRQANERSCNLDLHTAIIWGWNLCNNRLQKSWRWEIIFEQFMTQHNLDEYVSDRLILGYKPLLMDEWRNRKCWILAMWSMKLGCVPTKMLFRLLWRYEIWLFLCNRSRWWGGGRYQLQPSFYVGKNPEN